MSSSRSSRVHRDELSFSVLIIVTHWTHVRMLCREVATRLTSIGIAHFEVTHAIARSSTRTTTNAKRNAILHLLHLLNQTPSFHLSKFGLSLFRVIGTLVIGHRTTVSVIRASSSIATAIPTRSATRGRRRAKGSNSAAVSTCNDQNGGTRTHISTSSDRS